MSYPNAYCVKCGKHTDTSQKHTVMLQSGARALKGVCQACASDVYKILPKGKAYLSKVPLSSEERRRYPDAYCVKCKTHTPTENQHLVTFENKSRAVTGSCQKCGTEVYRIISPKEQGKALKATVKSSAPALSLVPSPERRLVASESAGERPSRWTYVAAAGLIAGIIIGFFVYSMM
jgi:hypothetical protein